MDVVVRAVTGETVISVTVTQNAEAEREGTADEAGVALLAGDELVEHGDPTPRPQHNFCGWKEWGLI